MMSQTFTDGSGTEFTIDDIVVQWTEEVFDQAEEIDPNDEHDWNSLVIGWALGKGYTVQQARAIAGRALATGVL